MEFGQYSCASCQWRILLFRSWILKNLNKRSMDNKAHVYWDMINISHKLTIQLLPVARLFTEPEPSNAERKRLIGSLDPVWDNYPTCIHFITPREWVASRPQWVLTTLSENSSLLAALILQRRRFLILLREFRNPRIRFSGHKVFILFLKPLPTIRRWRQEIKIFILRSFSNSLIVHFLSYHFNINVPNSLPPNHKLYNPYPFFSSIHSNFF